MKSFTGTESLTQLQSIATGIGAGITEAFVVVAFELVKIRMQDKANVWSLKCLTNRRKNTNQLLIAL